VKATRIIVQKPDAVATAYNTSYLRGRDQEDDGSRSAQICKTPSEQMPGMMACSYNPSYSGKHKQEDRSPGQPGPYLKNSQCNGIFTDLKKNLKFT
jgi:hypothetical protein